MKKENLNTQKNNDNFFLSDKFYTDQEVCISTKWIKSSLGGEILKLKPIIILESNKMSNQGFHALEEVQLKVAQSFESWVIYQSLRTW